MSIILHVLLFILNKVLGLCTTSAPGIPFQKLTVNSCQSSGMEHNLYE